MKVQLATLICVYGGDRPDLLRQALQSIADQRFSQPVDSHIYLGVDGEISADLEAVLNAFLPVLTKVYRSPVNRGLAHTLNELIQQLDQEQFVFRMDADDISLPDRFQRQLDFMDAHPDVDILGTAITEFDEVSGDERQVRFAASPEHARKSIHKRVPVAHPTVCFRRPVLDRVKGYPTAGTNEDIALWFKCLKLGYRFDNVDERLLRFRISPNFWKRRSWGKAVSELTCYVRGIYSLKGYWTTDYVFPMLRFLVRIAPVSLARLAYRLPFRTRGG